jgi:endonuclease III
MNLEIIKGIKLTGIGIKKIGDSLTMDENSANVLIRMGFAKKEEDKLTAKEVAELIEKVKNLEDLKQYSEDKRQVVELAYKKKSKELE